MNSKTRIVNEKSTSMEGYILIYLHALNTIYTHCLSLLFFFFFFLSDFGLFKRKSVTWTQWIDLFSIRKLHTLNIVIDVMLWGILLQGIILRNYSRIPTALT
jgi:hypothetical protein